MLNFNTPLRIVQAVLSLICLTLAAYVTVWYHKHIHASISPSSTSFIVAVSVFTIVTLPYLIFNPALSYTHNNGRPNGRYFNKWAVLALDALLMLFWFAGFIALAVYQRRLIICQGHVCQCIAGASAAGAVTWLTFLITFILATLHVVRTRGGEMGGGQVHKAWIGDDDVKMQPRVGGQAPQI